MKIKITGFYDEIAWYSKLVGKTYEVLEVNKFGEAKVKRGKGKYSYWVGQNDYELIGG
jgi:hypothetical protein